MLDVDVLDFLPCPSLDVVEKAGWEL